jgi:hypothetical protein
VDDKENSLMLYHHLKLGNGSVIQIPTSLPVGLQKYLNVDHLMTDADKLQQFKDKIECIRFFNKD